MSLVTNEQARRLRFLATIAGTYHTARQIYRAGQEGARIGRQARQEFDRFTRIIRNRRRMTPVTPDRNAIYRGVRRADVGRRVGQASAKIYQWNETGNLKTRTLYEFPMIKVPQDSNFDDALNEREAIYRINTRGVKLCMELMNKRGRPLYCHIAIVVPVNVETFTGDNFLRGLGHDVHTIPIGDLGKSDQYLNCCPINTDRFKVLSHKKFILGRKSSVTNPSQAQSGANERNYVIKRKYYKLNRQFQFKAHTDQTPLKNLHLCVWFYGVDGPDPHAIIDDAAKLNLQFFHYFREPAGR